MGLQILKNKIKASKKIREYFINKYYHPNIQINFPNKLLQFANTSIDISDGLIADLEKMINKQKLSYFLSERSIPTIFLNITRSGIRKWLYTANRVVKITLNNNIKTL